MRFKKRTYLILALTVFMIILISLRHQNPQNQKSRFYFIDAILIKIYSPLQKGISSGIDALQEVWENYVVLVGTKKQNKILQEELKLKELTILSLQERLRAQNSVHQLKGRFHLLGLEGVEAKVVAYDPYAISQTIWISEGSQAGIKEEGAVLSLEGLVGRVIKVFSNRAQVLLLTDSHFAVDVVNERSQVRALVVGNGRSAHLQRFPVLSHLEYFNLADDILPGDLLVTSGLGGLYPSSLPVGYVLPDKLKTPQQAEDYLILPTVDLSKLKHVFVVTQKNQ